MADSDNVADGSGARRRVSEPSDTNEAFVKVVEQKVEDVDEFMKGADFYAVELFCGTAGLTAVMRTVMPSSFGVDHQVTKPRSKVIKMDLSDANAQKLILQWVCDPRCVWVHMGVPCGTASRARDIKMSKTQHGPPPLRSFEFPDGLPASQLSPSNLARLRAANRLYRFMKEIILILPSTTIWTVENPWRSWLWSTSYFKAIKEKLSVFFVRFDMCMCGGKRLKKTGLATNCKHLEQYEIICDGQHEHLPFGCKNGQFDTASEAAYPAKFCHTLVAAVVEALSLNGVSLNKPTVKQSKLAAILSGKQPPKKVPNLVQEFAQVVAVKGVHAGFSFAVTQKQMLTRCYKFVDKDTQQELAVVHVGSKLLRRTPYKGGSSSAPISVQKQQQLAVVDSEVSISSCSCAKGCKDLVTCEFAPTGSSDEVVFGCPWDPVVFVKEVCKVGHPRDFISALPKEVEEAISVVASSCPRDVVIARCQWLGKYVALAKELETENDEMLKCMPPAMRRVMKCKRLALLRRIIQDEGYEDSELASDIAAGFSLVGEAPSSGGRLPEKFVPANLHVDELMEGSSKARLAVKLATTSSGDADMDSKLWLKTLEERDKGWLIGPIAWSDLEPHSVVSKRFPLQQGSKLRPIDDFSMSMVNATVSMRDQATTDGVDVIAAMMCVFMRSLAQQRKGSQIVARSFDLSAAYRQLCVAPSSYQFAYISVYNPDTGVADVFQQVCMPFGARAAVNAFIRCARCIQWIAARCLSLPTTCYYDDFVVVSTPELVKSSEACMSLLLDLLGWHYDKEGPKADAFSSMLTTLGVVFDLNLSGDQSIVVKNTEKRQLESLQLIDSTLSAGTLDKHSAQVLRGRIAFSYAQVFGMSGKAALQEVSSHAFRSPFVKALGDRLRRALSVLRAKLQDGKPRQVSVRALETVVVLTDACFSSDFSGGLGGVLVRGDGCLRAWYRLRLSSNVVRRFMREGQEVAIAELEALAALVAIQLWLQELTSRHIIFCLDNEVARFGFIKGYSNADMVTTICNIGNDRCEECVAMPWFMRVPSAANLADYPSRFVEHTFLNAELMVPEDETEKALQSVINEVSSGPSNGVGAGA